MSRRIRRVASGESTPCSRMSAPMRPDSGPKNAAPETIVIAKRTSPMTIQSVPKVQGPSTTMSPRRLQGPARRHLLGRG